MLINDALIIVDRVCSEYMCNRQQRIAIEQALAAIREKIQGKNEKPKVPKKEKKK